jgi:hypothetical protein
MIPILKRVPISCPKYILAISVILGPILRGSKISFATLKAIDWLDAEPALPKKSMPVTFLHETHTYHCRYGT